MSGSTEEVGIVVKAREQAASALGKTRAELDKVSQTVAKLRAQFKTGSGDSAALGAAMMRQAEVARRLQAETKKLAETNNAYTNAAKNLTDALAQHSRVAGLAVRAFGSLGIGAGLAAAAFAAMGAAVVIGAKNIADYQEQMDIAAEATGFTTGQLAGLKIAAAESGRSFDQIRPALDFFTRKVGDVIAESPEAVKQFYDLGIAVRDAGGNIRPTGDIFKDAQAKLSAMGTAGERSAAAMDLFGRSGAASISALLTPLDEAEAKARKLGIALGPEAERVARQADTAFDMLGTSIAAVGNSFGVTAATILKDFLPALAKAASQTAEFIAMRKSEDWAGNAARGFSWMLSGGKPQAFSGMISGMMPTSTEGMPWQWAVPEGDRPWGAGPGTPTAPKGKPWDESQGGSYSDTPFYSMPKLKPINISEDSWTTGSDARFIETLKNAKEEADRLAKSLEGYVSAADKAVQEQEEFTRRIEDGILGGVAGALENFAVNAIMHIGEIDKAFQTLGEQLLETLATAGIKAGIGSLFPGLMPFLQSGGTYVGKMQQGGTLEAFKAQSGVAIRGIRGVDNIPVMMGRDERIISHADNDQQRRVMSKIDSFIDNVGKSSMAAAGSSGGVTVNISYSGGGFGDADGLRLEQWTRDKLMPKLRTVLNKGGR